MFGEGVFALIILLIVICIYGFFKKSSTRTSQLTTRTLEFKKVKEEFKKRSLIYQIKRFLGLK